METIRIASLIIKQIGIPITTVIAIISTALAIWLSLKKYRLKVLSEIRLTKAAEIEADIQLLKAFSKLMNIAHARLNYQVSEKAVEMLLQKETILSLIATKGNLDLSHLLSQAVIPIPVGAASQDAAIVAVATLGKRHNVLLEAAIQALETLSGFKSEITDKHIIELKQLLHTRNTSY
ncbi:hypothetical protein [Hymenobacter sp. BT491]|uniref:hypothetical protein n=1 Tax=Hymenobacter sp. BT491 TaxID=2766779 RepID=UPI001653DD3B|nr:hypothetical protein [Hymenobacter sp. BT491]MBC6989091.1 hypothetical protein [Hymenobacter sp. BT491]